MITGALINLATKMVVDRLMLWLGSNIAFLALGPIGWFARMIAGYFIGKVVTVLLESFEDGVVFLGINLKVGREHDEYIEAFSEYSNAVTDGQRKIAQIKLDKAFDNFISLAA